MEVVFDYLLERSAVKWCFDCQQFARPCGCEIGGLRA